MYRRRKMPITGVGVGGGGGGGERDTYYYNL